MKLPDFVALLIGCASLAAMVKVTVMAVLDSR
jgi:hypothetical protein